MGESKFIKYEHEVVLVDNYSKDDSLEYVEIQWLELLLRIEQLGKNYDLTVANNLGVRLAREQWPVHLNANAFPKTVWLEKIIKATEIFPKIPVFLRVKLG